MADVNEQQTGRGSNGFANPAGASAAVLADPFNRKVESHLGDRVILKPLTRWNEAYKEFPRYVMEYLVSRYVDAE
jgi:predicted ATP-dependent Lon-type protease